MDDFVTSGKNICKKPLNHHCPIEVITEVKRSSETAELDNLKDL